MESVQVAASRPYRVDIGRGLLDGCGGRIRALLPADRVALIADETVDALYGGRVAASLQTAGYRVVRYAFAPGEAHKTLETVSGILDFLAARALTRADCVAALGGGIVGDVAGFAASIYLRGVPFVQLPTTFLAAIDSSVGGKTGVNLTAGKNLAGAFWQPSYVLCDCDTFATLPPAVFADGAAEAIKYGVLADAALFQRLEQGCLTDGIEQVTRRCVSIKSELVARDEFDRGERQLLNFGHTLGHAVEKCSGYAITHGHAVAVGMVAAARLGVKLGVTEDAALPDRLCAVLTRHNLPHRTAFSADALLSALLRDKKRMGDTIAWVLPRRIGQCVLHRLPVAGLPALLEGCI